ncbi:MAG TPA: diaminopimelate decarboxylase, partial [Candidatus Atribacteria bacterium]|nr:diaminopimelate decarboxylase [Candidatus Atribacteria bacterium]
KANPNLAICKILFSLGAGAEVSSLGELKTALKVGFEPNNILFVGPGKTEEEILYAVNNGIYALVAESVEEIQLIENTAEKLGKQVNVLLRINTIERPKVSPEIMVGGPSKFGFDEESVIDQLSSIRMQYVKPIGIHVYSASQILDSDFICEHLQNVLQLSLRLSGEIGFQLKCTDFGGGFGVPYHPGEKELELQKISDEAKRLLEEYRPFISNCRLIFEIGRFLVAEAGIFVTRVIRIKESRGKYFIITDGGINHLTRPAFMGVNHPVRILNKITSENQSEYEICGPSCTPLDVIGTRVRLPMPEEGDIIGIFNVGAYGYTMSMVNFLSFGWPKEIMVDDGKIFVIRKSKKPEQLFKDQPLPDEIK